MLLSAAPHTQTLVSSGIGEACAHAFAREGVRGVVLCDLNAGGLDRVSAALAASATNPDFQTLRVAVDVSKELDCQRIVEEAVTKFGRIDVRARSCMLYVRS